MHIEGPELRVPQALIILLYTTESATLPMHQVSQALASSEGQQNDELLITACKKLMLFNHCRSADGVRE